MKLPEWFWPAVGIGLAHVLGPRPLTSIRPAHNREAQMDPLEFTRRVVHVCSTSLAASLLTNKRTTTCEALPATIDFPFNVIAVRFYVKFILYLLP